MTATVEQTASQLLQLIEVAQRGEEVVITRHGHAVARLTGISAPEAYLGDRQNWLVKLARLRKCLSTGKAGPTVEQILDEDRGQ